MDRNITLITLAGQCIDITPWTWRDWIREVLSMAALVVVSLLLSHVIVWPALGLVP